MTYFQRFFMGMHYCYLTGVLHIGINHHTQNPMWQGSDHVSKYEYDENIKTSVIDED